MPTEQSSERRRKTRLRLKVRVKMRGVDAESFNFAEDNEPGCGYADCLRAGRLWARI